MRQKNVFDSAKERKFEDGVLRVDACFRRHSLPRKFEEQFPSEDVSLSFGRSALWEERRLQNKVAILISKGCKLLTTETLEEFVERNKEVLEEVI
ncbi:MAG: hypothetical protein Q8O13_10730 [Candidatus Omnitrophota bacterium]|nr:hypothetical protein [Candidatus Omnitrophota bacterium]